METEMFLYINTLNARSAFGPRGVVAETEMFYTSSRSINHLQRLFYSILRIKSTTWSLSSSKNTQALLPNPMYSWAK